MTRGQMDAGHGVGQARVPVVRIIVQGGDDPLDDGQRLVLAEFRLRHGLRWQACAPEPGQACRIGTSYCWQW